MSLLKRIEGAGSSPPSAPNAPATPETTPIRRPLPSLRDTSANELKVRVQNQLIAELDANVDISNIAQIRSNIQTLFDRILDQDGIIMTRSERQRLFEEVAADIIGFGPLEPLLRDDSISEIMVNGCRKVYVERRGKLEKTDVTFMNDEHVRKIIDKIIAPLGRRCDESSPMVDARLPDGSRVNAVIPPLALDGPTINVRKFAKKALSIDDLISYGTVTPEIAKLLQACVAGRLNIVVAGGTGSGKTTLLNVLSSFIPDDERIITIEDAAELRLMQEHVVRMETRKPNIEGKGAVTIRDLLINALRMRPDRIVVGECRGPEALDMLQAMNTGHDGSLTTLHANSPRDVIRRLEVMVLMAGMELPLRAVREQIGSAIQLIVFQERMRDGSRRVTCITEVQGTEDDQVLLQDIFVFEQTGFEDGKISGHIRPTGVVPRFLPRLEMGGLHLPPSIFKVDGVHP